MINDELWNSIINVPLIKEHITIIICCLGKIREGHDDTDTIELYGEKFTVEDLHLIEEHLSNY